MEPIQVWENHAGPIPPHSCGLIYKLVAYRDPEADEGRYGYGNTIEAAMLNYLEQELEHICSHCTEACSTILDRDDPRFLDCVMMDHNRDAWLRKWMPEDDTSHREWRAMNPLPSPRNDRGL